MTFSQNRPEAKGFGRFLIGTDKKNAEIIVEFGL
jgi:hypothetical protein